MHYYIKSSSVIKNIQILETILDTYVDENNKQQIIQKYFMNLIPAGTKGAIRGNIFNKLIKNFILDLNLDNKCFQICFETICLLHITTEIPDWYILEIKTNKIIIGMNQLDLISGGQQINRGYKYLIDNKHNTRKSKLLCVICNYTQLNSNKTKAYKLFEVGFNQNTLCYINGLQKIIYTYFNI